MSTHMQFRDEDIAVWRDRLEGLRDRAARTKRKADGLNPDQIEKSFSFTINRLKDDLQKRAADVRFIFDSNTEVESQTRQNIELFRRWYRQGGYLSLASLVILAAEHFDLSDNPAITDSLLTAAALGEVENDLDYHGNMHYRKVLIQAVRICAEHNDIYAGTRHRLTKEQIGLILIAACIHDLGHDGRGNYMEGRHRPSYLEERSFDLAQPFLARTGLDRGTLLSDLRVMLICTDVTPLDSPKNPVRQVKAAYRYHYLTRKELDLKLIRHPDLAILRVRPDLALMGLLLHEADIASSAGLSYAMSRFETALLYNELGRGPARPSHVVNFLDQICERQVLSNAGQKLYAFNMARIYALAEQDFKDGNHPYPESEDSDFLAGLPEPLHSGSKTVN